MRLTALALLALLCGCATTRSASSSGPDPRPLLWKVSDPKGAAAPLWLLGTVHLTRADYRMDRAIEQALAGAGDVYVELDLTPEVEQELQAQVLAQGKFPVGQSLEAALQPATWEAVKKQASALHLPVEALSTLRPWLVSVLLLTLQQERAQEGPRSGELGLDKRVTTLAREAGTAVHSLETVAIQLASLTEGDAESHEESLREALREVEHPVLVPKLFAAYEAGDLDALERLMLESSAHDRERMRHIFADRNAGMFKALQAAQPRARPALVAVGAGHMLGREGLVARFEAAGFRVEREAALGPGQPFVPRWSRVSEPGFSLEFPGQPRRSEQPLQGGRSVLHQSERSSVAFACEVTTVAGFGERIEATRESLFPKLAAEVVARGKGPLESSRVVQVAGRPALRMVARLPAARLELVLLDADGVLYTLRVASPGADAPADAERFFQSFTLAPR